MKPCCMTIEYQVFSPSSFSVVVVVVAVVGVVVVVRVVLLVVVLVLVLDVTVQYQPLSSVGVRPSCRRRDRRGHHRNGRKIAPTVFENTSVKFAHKSSKDASQLHCRVISSRVDLQSEYFSNKDSKDVDDLAFQTQILEF